MIFLSAVTATGQHPNPLLRHYRGFFGGVLSDTLTMILVYCLGGLAVAGILAWQFGLSFVMALGALALLVCGYFVMTSVSKIL